MGVVSAVISERFDATTLARLARRTPDSLLRLAAVSPLRSLGDRRGLPADAEPGQATAAPLDFLRLAAGVEQPMAVFQSGRVRISGDLFFAAQVQSMFEIPVAG